MQSEIVFSRLSGVAETLLIPLYVRALETQRPDGLMRDERALEFVTRMDAGFTRIKKIKMDAEDQVTLILRNRTIDRYTREFLRRNRDAAVVHIGCGLDSRFERVDDGCVEWYDLDLPDVIALRNDLLGDEAGRYHYLSASVFDEAWIDELKPLRTRPFLFIAEGVFTYFDEAQIRSVVKMLFQHFPGSELVFDAFTPFLVRMNNLRLRASGSPIAARYHWGLRHGRDLERWGGGVELLEEWHPFDQPEPRLDRLRWVRHVPILARVIGVFRYRLGA